MVSNRILELEPDSPANAVGMLSAVAIMQLVNRTVFMIVLRLLDLGTCLLPYIGHKQRFVIFILFFYVSFSRFSVIGFVVASRRMTAVCCYSSVMPQ